VLAENAQHAGSNPATSTKNFNFKKKLQTKAPPVDDRQKKYSKTEKGKSSIKKAQKKYDEADIERRRAQKRDYMRRKRAENPNYCKWK